jgi:hypothetical protein
MSVPQHATTSRKPMNRPALQRNHSVPLRTLWGELSETPPVSPVFTRAGAFLNGTTAACPASPAEEPLQGTRGPTYARNSQWRGLTPQEPAPGPSRSSLVPLHPMPDPDRRRTMTSRRSWLHQVDRRLQETEDLVSRSDELLSRARAHLERQARLSMASPTEPTSPAPPHRNSWRPISRRHADSDGGLLVSDVDSDPEDTFADSLARSPLSANFRWLDGTDLHDDVRPCL